MSRLKQMLAVGILGLLALGVWLNGSGALLSVRSQTNQPSMTADGMSHSAAPQAASAMQKTLVLRKLGMF